MTANMTSPDATASAAEEAAVRRAIASGSRPPLGAGAGARAFAGRGIAVALAWPPHHRGVRPHTARLYGRG